MKKVAIIGAGISGMTGGQLLKAKYEVTIFEKGSETRAERHINYCRSDGRRGLFYLSLLFGGA